MNLVIAEKPSVPRSIAAVIGADEEQNGYWQGGGYLVSGCIGHLAVSYTHLDVYKRQVPRFGNASANGAVCPRAPPRM